MTKVTTECAFSATGCYMSFLDPKDGNRNVNEGSILLTQLSFSIYSVKVYDMKPFLMLLIYIYLYSAI